MKKNLTDRYIRAIKPPTAGRLEIYDQMVLGLTLRVTASGHKTFAVAYRLPGSSRKQKVTLGRYPAIELADARRRARDVLKQLADGHDPSLARKADRSAPTVSELLEEFQLRELAGKKSGPEMHRLLAKDVLPAWGQRKAKDITRRDVALLLDDVRDRAPVTANRLHGRLTRLFNFACERGVIEVSPCTRMRKTLESPRDRVLSDDEIRAFWGGLEGTGMLTGTALALRLILATGQRPGEVAGMAWSELDGDSWTIPASRAKNGRAHRVPLCPMALDLLEQARAEAGDSAYVFPTIRQTEAKQDAPRMPR